MAFIFDGKAFAREREQQLTHQVQQLQKKGVHLRVKTLVFIEDEGSRLYTKLKKAAAERIGISYEPIEHSLMDSFDELQAEIRAASQDPSITGVMIQKPTKAVYNDIVGESGKLFDVWWETLTSCIDPHKDVDCLTPTNLQAIEENHPFVLPATVQACLSVLAQAQHQLGISDTVWKQQSVLVIGRSDIVGRPLAQILTSKFQTVQNVGRTDMPDDLSSFDIVISAVGKPNLIGGETLKKGVIVLDVGAPMGDIEMQSVAPKAAFVTPVPGGIGPMTVQSLMENVMTVSNT